MSNWDFSQWVKFGLVWAGVFAIFGGIIAQTTEGASGRGFVEGMWKGIEWFLIVVVGIAACIGVWYGVMSLASSLNH
jgi:hypothetical protein